MIEDRLRGRPDGQPTRPHPPPGQPRPHLPGDHRAARRDPAHRGPAAVALPPARRHWLQDQYAGELDEDTADVMRWWALVLERLERDPMEAAREVDWVAKLKVLQGYIDRDGLSGRTTGSRPSTSSGRTCGPTRGSSTGCGPPAASRSSSPTTRRSTPCTSRPPTPDTYFRGMCLAKYPDQIAAASWDSVIFDVPGHSSLQRVPMLGRCAARRERGSCSTRCGRCSPSSRVGIGIGLGSH